MSDEISSNEQKEMVELVDRHVNALAEHFDSVQIYVTKMEGSHDRTRQINRGAGNWFTRFGQINEWLIYEQERIRTGARPKPE